MSFSKGIRGVGESPWTPPGHLGGFGIGVGKKYSGHPLWAFKGCPFFFLLTPMGGEGEEKEKERERTKNKTRVFKWYRNIINLNFVSDI